MNKLILKEFLPYKLNLVTKQITDSLSEIYREYNLDRGQWRIIAHLGDKQDFSSSKEIREDVVLDKPYFSRSMHKLVQKGYVERTIEKTDRRNHKFRLTKSGEEFYAELIIKVLKWYKNLSNEIGSDTLEDLLRVLDQIEQK